MSKKIYDLEGILEEAFPVYGGRTKFYINGVFLEDINTELGRLCSKVLPSPDASYTLYRGPRVRLILEVLDED
jgi:hypothetical protein